jgi:iron(III) transport system ATP-binding protein
MIAGFEKPDAGRVRLGGDDVTDMPANARNMGFVFQNYALFPHLCVAENVAYGLEMRSIAPAEIASRVSEVLALVGLAGYEHQFSSQLSGGEQQRVALARAIVIQPRVLLFDEPLSNLDAKLRVQMRQEIRSLQRRLGITTIYVTHDQEEAMAVSDRIVVMSRGSVVGEGTAEALYHRPNSDFVARFIGRVNMVPATVVGPSGVRALGAELGIECTLAAGAEAVLVLRPEAIEVAPEGAPAHWTATVTERIFLGEKIEYTLRCGDATLAMVRYNAGPGALFSEGETLRLRVIESAASLLPREDA